MSNDFTDGMETEIRREEEDFKDLKNDLDFVVDLNHQLADKYEDLMSSFPTVKELDSLLPMIRDTKDYDEETRKKRLFQLNRFRSALVLLEKQDNRVKPQRYSEERFDAQ